MAAEKDEVREHSFDGIQEYDNDLPRWWINIFILTAIYSVGYIVYMHMGFRDADDVILAKQLAALRAQQKQAQPAEPSGAASGKAPAERLLALTLDSKALEAGKALFDTKCAACHRQDGGGLVGPNLTDEYWVHGGQITDIKQVVIKGVPAKGMVAWQGLMTPSEIDSVVAYIWSLKGSNPENPKAPEGEKVGGESDTSSDNSVPAESDAPANADVSADHESTETEDTTATH
jgi:cytochrome c oxidase cbb3-type subunit 3